MIKHEFGDPEALGQARAMAHAAAQMLYRAAVANLAPQPGAEHSNLGWAHTRAAFETRALNDTGCTVSLALAPFSLGVGDAALPLDGVTADAALEWLDGELAKHGLAPASDVQVSYDLPTDVTGLSSFEQVEGLSALAAWFDLAATSLASLAEAHADITPGPSAVRCWPHHFDIATYVSLETGDTETARGIGVGLSPGDGAYGQPYFYVNPWPHVAADALPDAIAPGHWHTGECPARC